MFFFDFRIVRRLLSLALALALIGPSVSMIVSNIIFLFDPYRVGRLKSLAFAMAMTALSPISGSTFMYFFDLRKVRCLLSFALALPLACISCIARYELGT